MFLTESKIKKLYSEYKKKGTELYQKNKLPLSLRYWQAAAYTAYTFYLEDTDAEIEEGLHRFSEQIDTKHVADCSSDRCVFYDAHSNDKGALTQQYIRAIFEAGWKMLYITEKPKPDSKFLPILKELEQHSDRVTIQYLPSQIIGKERLQLIYDSVVNWGGDKLFMHLYPWSVYAVATFQVLPSSITRYHINHTDHTFWAGVSCVDYNFEFREYGCNVSFHHRGIDASKLLLMPFYPIESDDAFIGFPFDTEGKIIVFSGGGYYKTFDEHDTYLHICKNLIDADPRVNIVYAGLGDKIDFQNRLLKNGITERFHLLGFRKDLSAIYEHSDFYLNTYPINGGLMCSFAAMHAVPILAYYSGENVRAESIVCQIGNVEISSSSIGELTDKAKSLFDDEDKRRAYGESIRACSIMHSQFNKFFRLSVATGKTQFPFTIDKDFVKPDLNRPAKINMINSGKAYQKNLVRILGYSELIFTHPTIAVEAVIWRGRTLLKKMTK